MELLPQLHAFVWRGQGNNCNSYLLASVLADGRHVLVDPGHVRVPQTREPGLEQLFSGMRQDGLDPAAIGLILLTHCHPDHIEAAGVIREQTGALVAIHRTESEVVAKFGLSVDLWLEEGDLKLGTRRPITIDVLHAPGHSPGHVVFYWKKERVLFGGDLVFYRSTGRSDLPGGSAEQLRQSIARLAKLDIEYLLCGHPYGHPGIIAGKAEVTENFTLLDID